MSKMKHILFPIFFFLMALPIMGQTSKTRSFSQRLFNAKVEHIAKALNMSDKKKAAFLPIYKSYSEEMIKLWNELVSNSKDEMEQLKFSMRRQEKSQAIRLKYTDLFAKVLSAEEIRKFYQVENNIQQRLKEKKIQGGKSSNMADPAMFRRNKAEYSR